MAGESIDPEQLDAGDFGAWLARTQGAIRGETTADVPCGSCTACCTSSQFVHIEPDETRTLARIPAELLVPAPGLPEGHVVLGYDDRGHCPMLQGGRCSIYEDRPRACRTYDCRVFPAAGIEPDRPEIARRTRRWRFTHPTEDDRALHDAVREAAASLPGDTSATQRAIRAIELHRAQVEPD